MRLVRGSIALIGTSLIEMKPEEPQQVVVRHLSTDLTGESLSSFDECSANTTQRNYPQSRSSLVLQFSPPEERVLRLAQNPMQSASAADPEPFYKIRDPASVSTRPISSSKRKTTLASLQQSTYMTILAGIHYQLRTTNLESGFEDDCNSVNKQQHIDTCISVHPKPWLLGRGFAISYSTSGNSWIPQFGFQLRHFNIRPVDALIFEFCFFGNIEGVKSLLRRQEASPFDCDPERWTTLHVCSSLYHSIRP